MKSNRSRNTTRVFARAFQLVFLLLLGLAPLVLDGCAGFASGTSSPSPTTVNITNVQAIATTSSSSQITWTTDIASNSVVNYGTTTSYGSSTPVDPTMVTNHQVTISGLSAGTTYYYQVQSTDAKNNNGKSGGHKFKTAGVSVSGTITPTKGGAGATVTLSGTASATTTADSSGAYTFTGLASGSYAVTPSNAGYTFTPANQNVTVSTTNVTGVNFTATGTVAAPAITTQPASQTVTPGQTATFAVTATGTAPLSYQWQKNGANIAGATSASYTTPATATSDSGSTFVAVVSNSVGTATSNAATLTVNPAPVAPTITTQPTNQTVTAGQAATFTVVATGTAPLSYQWQKNGANIAGATSVSYTTPATTTSDNGSTFAVVVSNSAGTATSNAVTLTVNPAPAAPTINTQPTNQTVTAGQTATFLVVATGAAPLSYQWAKNGASIPGATTSSYTTPAATASDNGSQFTVAVSNSAGSVTSSPAILTVSSGGLATDCTIFASPSGNDVNSGTSATSPKTFSGAAAATQPGSVLCLLAGTYNLSSSFNPPTNGSPSAWIVYKSYGDGAVHFVWTGPADASAMFHLGSGAFPTGPSYLEFRGLNVDGKGNAGDAFFCRGGHHLRFIGNSISNTGGSGVGSRDCDYLTADHNIVYHNGYMPASTSVPQWYGWTSGISFNSDQWFDNYAGFHNVIANNIVVGEYDSSSNHTDGNGIILDLSNGSYSASTANTPPALIINNVVYGNGGRCIEAFVVTNFWIVNNTCYKNNLDASLGNAASLTTNNSHDGYFINNISVAWDSSNPTYSQEGTNASISYYANLYYGSSLTFTPIASAKFLQADPLFVNPPSLTGGQYATALAPSLLGAGLTLLPTSPAIGTGIDPTTLPSLPAEIVNDLRTYFSTDINGKGRPQGGSFDLGAYQH